MQSSFTLQFAGIDVAPLFSVAENPPRERGAQEEKPGEREVRNAPSTRQDFTRPKEGRDVPPAEETEKGTRAPESPWMGGG
jgi:hypothetical protein